MNLYLRLFWTLLRARWLPKLSIADTFHREFRVLLNDIDVNLHMNNGRYLTLTDLMLVEYFARTGFLKALIQNKWRPVVGGAIITYRRQLKLGQKYRLSYRWAGGDGHWNYLSFQFSTVNGTLCACGYSKGAAVSRNGLVPNARSFEALGIAQPDGGLPDAVVAWKQSEAKLIS
ncbi:MAG: thioesterase family protein [Lysobacterales bacterium]